MRDIRQPLDFHGVNIYQGSRVRAGKNGQPELVPAPVGHPMTAFRWPITPEALYWGPRFLHERYGKPIYVTENGLANADWIALDGKVHDPQRIDFLHRHLRELKRACADGVDVRGYFQWSIMDNFEWAEGYRERFGLVYVDYPTQRRIPKDSAYWYKGVIESNGADL
jgi:beta-glucosidase